MDLGFMRSKERKGFLLAVTAPNKLERDKVNASEQSVPAMGRPG